MEREVSERDADSTLNREVVRIFVMYNWNLILTKLALAGEEMVNTGVESLVFVTALSA